MQKNSAFGGLRNTLLSTWCRTEWFLGVRNFHVSHPGKTASQGPWLSKGGHKQSSRALLSRAPVEGTAVVLTSLHCSVTLFLKSDRCVQHEPGHLPAQVSPMEAGVTVYRKGHYFQAAPLEKTKNSHLTENWRTLCIKNSDILCFQCCPPDTMSVLQSVSGAQSLSLHPFGSDVCGVYWIISKRNAKL